MKKELILTIDKKIEELRDQNKLLDKLDRLAYWYYERNNKDYDNDRYSPFPYIEEDQMILYSAIIALEQTKRILSENKLTNLSLSRIKKLLNKYK